MQYNQSLFYVPRILRVFCFNTPFQYIVILIYAFSFSV